MFLTYQNTMKPASFDVDILRGRLKKFNLGAKKSGGGIFIGSQLQSIDKDTFVEVMTILNSYGFSNNDWATLLSNAEQGILCGFQVFMIP